jgi:hypothetical protein
MIGQHHHSVDGKWQLIAHVAQNTAQRIDMLDEKRSPSITEINRKEKRSAGYATAPILNHLETLSRNTLRSFRATFATPSP